MKNEPKDNLNDRVRAIAKGVLERSKVVGPFDILIGLQWLYSGHLEEWRKGIRALEPLEQMFQSTPAKRDRVYGYFLDWVRERGLRPVQATYVSRSVRQSEPLRVTASGDDAAESFFRTQYMQADLSSKQAERLEEKLTKAPEIVVFIISGATRQCHECGRDLVKSMFSVVEKSEPLCLDCADLDHLIYLPAGDAALTRRAKKHSPLSAVVVKINRSRKRYERQGLLVTEGALERAENECIADAAERAARRETAALLREVGDKKLVAEMTKAIGKLFPSCPAAEARRIAEHTADRGSGRVGRSAAGRNLDPTALEFAVVAHIRHAHTRYDELLMRGVERQDAREMIRQEVQATLDLWRREK